MPNPKNHIPALDGVRGLAILLVMTHHLARVPTLAMRESWNSFAYGCWIGVDLFFVLSSFLITRGLLDALTRDENSSYYSSFFAKRALRIFPLYFAFLLAYWVLVVATGALRFQNELVETAARDLFAVSLFAGNIQIAAQGAFLTSSLTHLWSIAVEEQFYLIWPFFIAALKPQRLWIGCGALVAGAVALRCLMVAKGNLLYASHNLMPTRIDTFAIGAMVALASRSHRAWLEAHAKWVALAGTLCLSSFWVWRGFLNPGDTVIQTVGYTVLAVTFAGLVGACAAEKSSALLARFISNPVLRFFGKYSFGLYVFHHPVHVYVDGRWPVSLMADYVGSGWRGMIMMVMTVLPISLGLAWVSFHLIEKPFLALKPRESLLRDQRPQSLESPLPSRLING